MLVKAADNKERDVEALTALLTRPGLHVATRRRVETKLRRLQAGIRGEREAAHEIEFHYGTNPNRMTIHDLRLDVDGRVAQIDHLLLDRLMGIWVCESKYFSEGVAVDDLGEWAGFYNGRPYGIGSPIEQNRKHLVVLKDAFAKGLVALPKRLGITIKPQFRSLILVSKEARISRPKTKAGRARVDGLESVIKVDQLKTLLDQDVEATGLAAFRRLVGKGEIESVARQLVALHRPAVTDWHAKFGLPAEPMPSVVRTRLRSDDAAHERATCHQCGRQVSRAVVEFSEARSEAFGDRILCMDCQRKARKGQI
jgi:hypothetical protein